MIRQRSIFISIVVSIGLIVLYCTPETTFKVHCSNSFAIPSHCKHLGLLGCTPQPAQYLNEHGNDAKLLENITLDCFLDSNYVRDSFAQRGCGLIVV